MKTKEELNVLREECERLNKKLAALTEDELAQVTAGLEIQDLTQYFIPPENPPKDRFSM